MVFVVSICDVLLEECVLLYKQAEVLIGFAHSMPSSQLISQYVLAENFKHK